MLGGHIFGPRCVDYTVYVHQSATTLQLVSGFNVFAEQRITTYRLTYSSTGIYCILGEIFTVLNFLPVGMHVISIIDSSLCFWCFSTSWFPAVRACPCLVPDPCPCVLLAGRGFPGSRSFAQSIHTHLINSTSSCSNKDSARSSCSVEVEMLCHTSPHFSIFLLCLHSCVLLLESKFSHS